MCGASWTPARVQMLLESALLLALQQVLAIRTYQNVRPYSCQPEANSSLAELTVANTFVHGPLTTVTNGGG
jgi:hypothetical protein